MGLLDDFLGKDSINQLKQRLAEAEAQLIRAIESLKVVDTNREVAEREVDKQKLFIAQRDEALTSRDKCVVQLHEKNLALVQDIEELKRKVAEQQQRLTDLTLQNTEQAEALILNEQRSSASLIEAQTQADHLKHSLQSLAAELSSLKDQQATLKADYERDQTLYAQKDRDFHDREASLAKKSEDLRQKKDELLIWADRLKQQESHWLVEIEPQVHRYAAHQSLDQRQVELSDFNLSLAALHDELLEKEKRLELQQTAVEQRSVHLEDWARDLFVLQGRVNNLDADAQKFSQRVKEQDEKERERLSEHSQRQSELRDQKSFLKRQASELDARSMDLDARERQVSRVEDQQEKLKAKLLDTKRALNAVTSESAVLETEKNEALSALRKVDAKYKALLSIQVSTSGDPLESSLSHPKVLEWLLERAVPESAGVNQGWLGMTGHGPWGSGELEAAFDDLGYRRYLLPDADIEHLVVGRNDWLKSDLLNQIDARNGSRLRVYSQEMFFAKLVTGQDPFDAGDPDLLAAFAEEHPALQFLMSLPEPWPEASEERGPVVKVSPYDFGIAESPLHIFQYKVGSSSDLTAAKRRKLLSSFFEADDLEFSDDSDDGYRAKWGRPGSAQRLYRMASHIKHLVDGPGGKDYRKPQARADWIEDMKWLKEQYFDRFKRKFSWPGDRS